MAKQNKLGDRHSIRIASSGFYAMTRRDLAYAIGDLQA
jgi:hypothetical protein